MNTKQIAEEAAAEWYDPKEQSGLYEQLKQDFIAAIEKAKKQWIANLSGEPADAREPIVPMPAHASEGHTITEIHEKIQSGMEAARHTLEYQQEGIELAAHASEEKPMNTKQIAEDEVEAAKKLCEIYFNIAAEVIGEDEVRKRRDAILKRIYARSEPNR